MLDTQGPSLIDSPDMSRYTDSFARRFDQIDPTPAHNSAHPFDQSSTVAFSIRDTTSEEPSTITVSEITTRHLRRLKESATDYLGREVTAAVISIPTDFSDAQKEALTAAAKGAGIEILQLVPEPIAALLAHDRREASKITVDRTVVVADLGGTRSDVAVVSVRGGMYTILATAHDFTIGGAALDNVLIEYFSKEFLKKHKNATDPRQNARSLAKVRLESEAVKKALSLGSSAGFNVESLSDGLDFSCTINRSRYELLANKTFASFQRLIETAVSKASLDPLDIDEVLVSGGTAHTPRIAQNLQRVFPESTKIIAPATDTAAVNPSELTARGAALQAYLVQDFDREDVEQSTHPGVTVTPHLGQTLGLVVPGADGTETFRPVLQAETPLPVRRTMTFTLGGASETGALLRLCEGIREIKVTAPPPRPAKPETEDEDDEDDDDDEEDDEPTREKLWKVGAIVGELALRDVKKGAKITVQISVGVDLDITVSAMEVGAGKAGVRGQIPGQGGAANGVMNGAAH